MTAERVASSTNTTARFLTVLLLLAIAWKPVNSWLSFLQRPGESALTELDIRARDLSWNQPRSMLGIDEHCLSFSVYVDGPVRGPGRTDLEVTVPRMTIRSADEPDPDPPRGETVYMTELRSLPEGASFSRDDGERARLHVDASGGLWSLSIGEKDVFSYEDRVRAMRGKAVFDSVAALVIALLVLAIPGVLRVLATRVLDPGMPIFRLYFALDAARIGRAVYWVYGLLPLGLTYFVFLMVKALHTPFHMDEEEILLVPFFLGGAPTPALTVMSLVLTFNAWALALKRCNDRERSPLFLLLLLVPLLNLWPLVELCFLSGRHEGQEKRRQVGFRR